MSSQLENMKGLYALSDTGIPRWVQVERRRRWVRMIFPPHAKPSTYKLVADVWVLKRSLTQIKKAWLIWLSDKRRIVHEF